MYKPLTLTIALIFPILGLISCSKKEVPDKWRLAPPKIKTSTGTTQNLHELASYSSVDASALLTFENVEGIELSVYSRCFGDAETNQTQKISLSNQLALSQLLPKQIWETLNLPSELKCDLQFAATNAIGSVHNFEIKNLTVKNFASVETLDRNSFVTSSARGEVSLQCENFSNYRKAINDLKLDDLLYGPVADVEGLRREDFEEKRAQYPYESCRIMLLPEDKSSPVMTTPLAKTKFPAAPLMTTYTLGLGNFRESSPRKTETTLNDPEFDLFNTPFIELEIRNPNKFPVTISIPSTDLLRVSIQQAWKFAEPVQFHASWATKNEASPMVKLKFSRTGGAAERNINGRTYLDIPADASVRFAFNFAEHLQVDAFLLSSGERFNPNPTIGFQHIGFTFMLNQPFTVLRHFVSSVSNEGPTEDITPYPLPTTSNNGVLDGWMPRPSFANAVGVSNRPTLTPQFWLSGKM